MKIIKKLNNIIFIMLKELLILIVGKDLDLCRKMRECCKIWNSIFTRRFAELYVALMVNAAVDKSYSVYYSDIMYINKGFKLFAVIPNVLRNNFAICPIGKIVGSEYKFGNVSLYNVRLKYIKYFNNKFILYFDKRITIRKIE